MWRLQKSTMARQRSLDSLQNFPELYVSFSQKIGSGRAPIQTYFQPARTPAGQSPKRVQTHFSALTGLQVHPVQHIELTKLKL